MKRILLALPLLLLLAGCAGGPAHTEKEVADDAIDFLTRYYGVWNISVLNATPSGGYWFVKVNYTSEKGWSVTKIIANDANLSEKWELLNFVDTPIGIAPIQGKLSCSEGGKIKVILFTDPYCEACVKAEEPMAAFREKFKDSVDFEYRVLLTESDLMADKYGFENASAAAKYFVCAREQGNEMLDPIKACALEKYANHTGIPLSKEELDQCLPEATQLDVGKFDSCLQAVLPIIDFDYKLAFTYLSPQPITPRVVIDCTERATPRTAEYALCKDFQKNRTISGCPVPEKPVKKAKNATASAAHE